MKNKNILVIGYFGTVNNQVDGQTIRTQNIYALLKENIDGPIHFFDTQTLKDSKINYLKFLKLVFKADVIFNIAAHRNLKVFFPILYNIALITKSEIHYIAIGGWLFQYLQDKPVHMAMLKRVKNVFVQTNNLCQELQNIGFKNVHLLNNFRLVDFPKIDSYKESFKVKNLVFMARVHPMKGVDTLFKLDEKLKTLGEKDVRIDIYGPIVKEYETDFHNKVEDSSFIRYCGVVEPSDVYKTLKQYDLLLFPTQYYTEGFPGSILDAYISGIPVIATEWINAHEFIEQNKTGYIVEFNNELAFIDKVLYIIEDPNEIKCLRQNISTKRNEYSANHAWKTLRKHI